VLTDEIKIPPTGNMYRDSSLHEGVPAEVILSKDVTEDGFASLANTPDAVA
jgi:hypothetical protein